MQNDYKERTLCWELILTVYNAKASIQGAASATMQV